jgi:hypothetical protein
VLAFEMSAADENGGLVLAHAEGSARRIFEQERDRKTT